MRATNAKETTYLLHRSGNVLQNLNKDGCSAILLRIYNFFVSYFENQVQNQVMHPCLSSVTRLHFCAKNISFLWGLLFSFIIKYLEIHGNICMYTEKFPTNRRRVVVHTRKVIRIVQLLLHNKHIFLNVT